ncbi:hypothetical protein MKW98_020916 [Papaver atlanticum]|uniref:Aminoacyl-transfer RNA synthetases class-II family profile domain-containing protein n=1 Tax=Papaver atlanticum TaxID=357466 RepID=A0AAD4THM6_9MAGN|nr:hypothetical protein MKW98_020916 [Papaver atlanticum]
MAQTTPLTTKPPAATPAETLPSSSSSSAIWSEFSKRVLIKNIIGRPDGGVGLAGEKIKVGGWVKTRRKQGKGSFAFLELNDGSSPANLQVIVDSSVVELSQIGATGTCVFLEGVLKKLPERTKQKKLPEGTKQSVELGVEQVLEIGGVDHPAANLKYPLPKTKLTLEFLRDYLHLTPRTNMQPINSLRSMDSLTFRHLLSQLLITEKLGKELKENPGMRLPQKDGKLDYSSDFFARQACLTVSGQLQVETLACALGNVYTFGPTFRAEHSHTSRHLAEFWMDDMNCAEAHVKFLSQWLLDNCLDDMQFMVKNFDKTAIDRLKLVSSTPFERITYTDAVALLEKVTENKFEKAHERYLTEVIFKKPAIVYNYPKGIKPFYMRLNDDDKAVAAMDVESQREERYHVIEKRMLDQGLPLDPYQWYLDLRRYGTVKHSGFGLGFERMVLFATGLDNIRDVIPFPRYPGKAIL